MENLPQHDLADQTLQKVRRALEGGKSVAVPEVIHLIQELSAKAFSITIKELAELISRDVAVTAKVIGAANTVGYNPTGRQVNTITQAIHLLGFEKVRNLAISLLLIENAERSLTPAEQRDSAALALSSGLLAQSFAANHTQIDPEQAFVCASLRNYGRLLMTTFLIEGYREAQSLRKEYGSDEAYRKVFGLTPLELGYHLLLSAHLPRSILRSLQSIRDETVRAAAQSPEDELLMISDFSVQVCEATMDGEISEARFSEMVASLQGRYGKSFKVSGDEIRSLLGEVNQALRSLERHNELRSTVERARGYFRARAAKKEPPAREDIQGAPIPEQTEAPTLSPPGKSTPPVAPPPAGEDFFVRNLTALTEMLAQSPIDIERVYRTLIDSFHEGLGVRDTLFFLRRPASNVYLLTQGRGRLADSLKGKLAIASDRKDVFGISLSRGEDVLIEDAGDAKIIPYLPGWMINAKLRSFILLPIVDGHNAFGVICGGCSNPRRVNVNHRTLQHLKAMRIHVSTAKRMVREI